jgi:hypothetical protein
VNPREILNAEVEDREAIPYDDEYYTELASQYASTAAKEKKMAPEWYILRTCASTHQYTHMHSFTPYLTHSITR